MPTYRIGSALGRPTAGRTPHAVVCETCNEELDEQAPVERGQESFSGMTVAGLLRLWPGLEQAVKLHESYCHGKKQPR
jgi:hypothetical protein